MATDSDWDGELLRCWRTPERRGLAEDFLLQSAIHLSLEHIYDLGGIARYRTIGYLGPEKPVWYFHQLEAALKDGTLDSLLDQAWLTAEAATPAPKKPLLGKKRVLDQFSEEVAAAGYREFISLIEANEPTAHLAPVLEAQLSIMALLSPEVWIKRLDYVLARSVDPNHYWMD
jgi:hypothetical protein